MVACMWSVGRRKQLAERAAAFDGALVLGCRAAVENVKSAMGGRNGRVIQGMEIESLMNLLPVVRFPLNISLVVKGITSVEEEKESEKGVENNVLTLLPPTSASESSPAIKASGASN